MVEQNFEKTLKKKTMKNVKDITLNCYLLLAIFFPTQHQKQLLKFVKNRKPITVNTGNRRIIYRL